MKKRFIELEIRTYLGKQYRDYLKSMEENEETPDEGDEWKMSLDKEEAQLPTIHPTKVFIDPDKIITYIETFSMEEAHQNPENPVFDSIDIHLQDGIQITAICTIKEFNKKLDNFYKEKEGK